MSIKRIHEWVDDHLGEIFVISLFCFIMLIVWVLYQPELELNNFCKSVGYYHYIGKPEFVDNDKWIQCTKNVIENNTLIKLETWFKFG